LRDSFMINLPSISTCITAYNHAKYISQCLDSVLMQETGFDYEILVGEDDSSDGTREICIEYAQRYPDRIRLFLNDRKNVIYINGRPTGRWNVINLLMSAKGKYIALIDGDDYWTSPHKLQKQADFLDDNPDCSMCFHDVQIVSEEGNLISVESPRGKRRRYFLKDLLKGNFIHTCSVMYRRGLFKEFPDWFYKTPLADWPLHILNAEHGDIGYISEVMGAYRIHCAGIHSSRGELEKVRDMIKIYPYINAHLNYRYNSLIKSRMYFKVIEKKVGIFLNSHGFGRVVSFYRKIFY
jgi:glycosyltransferase involved in cell wall biosynthesis